jgi:hypothetical protein
MGKVLADTNRYHEGVTAARPTNKLPAESPKIIADQKLPQELYENLHKEEARSYTC